mmetsp:Transcript_15242/g.22821  ORF Transcript_15242/g.22821 Transcript_15242/m.22821 type:complete len:251 (+) Transcript_15242:741-1493(+)
MIPHQLKGHALRLLRSRSRLLLLRLRSLLFLSLSLSSLKSSGKMGGNGCSTISPVPSSTSQKSYLSSCVRGRNDPSQSMPALMLPLELAFLSDAFVPLVPATAPSGSSSMAIIFVAVDSFRTALLSITWTRRVFISRHILLPNSIWNFAVFSAELAPAPATVPAPFPMPIPAPAPEDEGMGLLDLCECDELFILTLTLREILGPPLPPPPPTFGFAFVFEFPFTPLGLSLGRPSLSLSLSLGLLSVVLVL